MGRYRGIVDAVVAHGNLISRMQSYRECVSGRTELSFQEWQILEYIVGHRFETFSMSDMSASLKIPQSTFSKIVKYLCQLGLVEKYQAVNNRKNIILKPSEEALELYAENSESLKKRFFSPMFSCLENVSDESLEAVVKAIETLDERIASLSESDAGTEIELVRKE